MKRYIGFAIRIEGKEIGTFFKRKKQEEIFGKMTVGANSFIEAQEILCNGMQAHKISIAFIFPYVKEDAE